MDGSYKDLTDRMMIDIGLSKAKYLVDYLFLRIGMVIG